MLRMPQSGSKIAAAFGTFQGEAYAPAGAEAVYLANDRFGEPIKTL